MASTLEKAQEALGEFETARVSALDELYLLAKAVAYGIVAIAASLEQQEDRAKQLHARRDPGYVSP